METTSNNSLLPSNQDPITKSSCSIKVLGTKLEGGSRLYSWITNTLLPSTQQQCRTTGLSIDGQSVYESACRQDLQRLTYAIALTAR